MLRIQNGTFYFGIEIALVWAWQATMATSPWSPSSVIPIVR